jgi:hypothetical protein
MSAFREIAEINCTIGSKSLIITSRNERNRSHIRFLIKIKLKLLKARMSFIYKALQLKAIK